MVRVSVLAALLSLSAGLPVASQDEGGWSVEVEALPAPEYDLDSDFNPAAKAAYDAGMAENAVREAAIKAEVKSSLDFIDGWSRSAGFPPPTRRIARVQSTCDTSPFALSASTPGADDAEGDSMRVLWKALERTRSRSANEATVTMAHEFMHMVQFGPWRSAFVPAPFAPVQWITESTAEAFAAWYLMSRGTSRARAIGDVTGPTDYSTPLHFPAQNAVNAFAEALSDASVFKDVDVGAFDRSDECRGIYVKATPISRLRGAVTIQDYRRAEFFFYLGSDLDPAAPHAWLARAAGLPLDGAEFGLRWLDGIIRTESAGRWRGLFEYWPEFVARHADDPERHFRTYAKEPLAFSPEGEDGRAEYEGRAEGVAADPREIAVSFADGAWPISRKPENQVFLLVQQFEAQASAEDPRTLVVDARAVEKPRPFKRAVWANPKAGELKLLNRVANVARDPWETRPVDYRIKLSLERVRWDPPRCVIVGQPFTLAVDPRDSIATQDDIAEQIRNGYAEWRIEGAGRIVDAAAGRFVLDAPGVAKISFMLRYGTRAKPRDLPVRVATLEASGDDCQIQVKAPGQPFTMTYSRNRDYSETVVTGGAKIYFGMGRVAVYDPEAGGWIDLPPAVQAMMHAQFNTQYGSLPELPPWAPDRDAAFFARIPLVFQTWWDMRDLTDAMEDDPSVAVFVAWACLPEVTDCREIRVLGADGGLLVYDAMDRLVRMDMRQGGMDFAFGRFEIGRPPGWEDRPNMPEPPVSRPEPRPAGSENAPGGDGVEASASPSPTGIATNGGACDCSCAGLLAGAAEAACAPRCAVEWAVCAGKP